MIDPNWQCHPSAVGPQEHAALFFAVTAEGAKLIDKMRALAKGQTPEAEYSSPFGGIQRAGDPFFKLFSTARFLRRIEPNDEIDGG
jgi:hypothetical protein